MKKIILIILLFNGRSLFGEYFLATNYLNKFAKLVRNILNSSRHILVSFSKIVETMGLYIDLELLRNEEKSKVIFNIQGYLYYNNYIVLPLSIHLYIENTIIHGIRNKSYNIGTLTINVRFNSGLMKYVIIDN